MRQYELQRASSKCLLKNEKICCQFIRDSHLRILNVPSETGFKPKLGFAHRLCEFSRGFAATFRAGAEAGRFASIADPIAYGTTLEPPRGKCGRALILWNWPVSDGVRMAACACCSPLIL